MLRNLWRAGLLIALACLLPFAAAGEKGKFTAKTAESAPPKELSEPIRKLLPSESVQFVDAAGKAVAEIWLRSAIPTDNPRRRSAQCCWDIGPIWKG